MSELRFGRTAWALLAALVLVLGLMAGGSAFAMGDAETASECETAEEGSAKAEECAQAAEDAAAAEDAGEGAEDAGDASDTGSGPVITCPEGFEVTTDEATGEKNCKLKSSGLIRELPAADWAGAEPAFVEAAVLAHSGEYERAIEAFTALGRPDDAYVLNYLGFASRKLGRTEEALAYYHRALAIRPDYVRVREYLGEGYVALGRIGEARGQLTLIAAECGTGCEEYRALAAAIAALAAGGPDI